MPYNAGAIANDALWAGLPLVTCAGESYVSRMAGSLLRAAGVPELVTYSLADYEALALKLAADPAALAAVKTKLVHNRQTCALFDIDRYRRHLERAYEMIRLRSERGKVPATFTVPPITS